MPAEYSIINNYIVGPNVDLTGADLAGANLITADLTGVDLTGADLTNADLTGANLYGAVYGDNLTQAQLDSAVFINTVSFTATVDQWQSDGNGAGMDGPSIKLHRKDESFAETVKHIVTVDTGTNDYGAGNKYFIDGIVSPSLTMVSGKTYEFDLSGVPGSHPFQLSTSPNGNIRWWICL